jgi:hypothetical protein
MRRFPALVGFGLILALVWTAPVAAYVGSLEVTDIDQHSDTVSGIADAFVEVTVTANGVVRHVTSDPSGFWVADFAIPGDEVDEQDLHDIQVGSSGEASVVYPSGTVVVSWEFSDTTPPQLEHAVFVPDVIDITTGSQTARLRLWITDEGSGFCCNTSAVLMPPSMASPVYFAFGQEQRVEGNAYAGIYEVEFAFPQGGELGVWVVQSIVLMDNVGNTAGTVGPVAAVEVVADSDIDGDGVLDEADICPDTDLDADVAPADLKKNRVWSTPQGDFAFGDGSDAGLSVGDTDGCSASQIIALLGLGGGHERFGISQSVIADLLA